MNLWQRFLADGDKLLLALAVFLESPQGQSLLPGQWAPLAAVAASAIHTVVLPDPTPTTKVPAATPAKTP
jgi:hypothetical protein